MEGRHWQNKNDFCGKNKVVQLVKDREYERNWWSVFGVEY